MAKKTVDAQPVGKIGRNEIKWVSAYDKDHNLKYVITSNKDRTVHFIYDAYMKKLGSNPNPNVLEEKYFGKD